MSIENTHLPKHKILSIDIVENAVLALLLDEFLQIGYVSIAISCDRKESRIPLHETVDLIIINCVNHYHRRGKGAGSTIR